MCASGQNARLSPNGHQKWRKTDENQRTSKNWNDARMVKNLKRIEKAWFRSRNFLAQLLSETSRACTIRVRQSSSGRLWNDLGSHACLHHRNRRPGTFTEERISGRREPDPESPNQRQVAVIRCRKATLAEIAHRLGRKALEELAAVARPDTLLAWYRKLIANKFDGSKFRKFWGRPRIGEETERLVVRMAKENPGWGYDRIVGAMANLGHRFSDQAVGNILRAMIFHRLVATDFFTVEVLTLRGLITYYVMFFIHLESRRISCPTCPSSSRLTKTLGVAQARMRDF
jgi:hypothetical protein